ncbi:MAG: hypothetical protein WCF85_04815 [Rhodospirillaceae bacterium]
MMKSGFGPVFGKGFAKAMAAAAKAGASGASGASCTASGFASGVAGAGSPGENSVNIVGAGAVGGRSGSVTIINGKVWIDGEAVADDVETHTSADGRNWRIRRDGGRVDVNSD